MDAPCVRGRRPGRAAALAAMPTAVPAQAVSGIPFVVDGDTLGFGETRVRLHGIHAEAEAAARDGRLDVWADESTCQPPWVWRRR